MPKITRFGGHSIAGITDTATGQTEHAAGFTDDTAATQAKAEQLQDDGGEPDTGLVVGGDVGDEELPFDPSLLSVADVNALLAECSPTEREAVLEAERNDKNRKGIVGE